jgi:hypothetical protein
MCTFAQKIAVMSKHKKICPMIPENSTIKSDFGKIDYFDTYHVVKSTNETAEEVAIKIFTLPKWVNWLMCIRNSIARIFGLKEGQKNVQTQYFTVIEQTENEIVMGENDKHLNFKVSVLIDREKSLIYVTTIVCFNNFWGRLYFLFVKPFHKLIVKSI